MCEIPRVVLMFSFGIIRKIQFERGSFLLRCDRLPTILNKTREKFSLAFPLNHSFEKNTIFVSFTVRLLQTRINVYSIKYAPKHAENLSIVIMQVYCQCTSTDAVLLYECIPRLINTN